MEVETTEYRLLFGDDAPTDHFGALFPSEPERDDESSSSSSSSTTESDDVTRQTPIKMPRYELVVPALHRELEVALAVDAEVANNAAKLRTLDREVSIARNTFAREAREFVRYREERGWNGDLDTLEALRQRVSTGSPAKQRAEPLPPPSETIQRLLEEAGTAHQPSGALLALLLQGVDQRGLFHALQSGGLRWRIERVPAFYRLLLFDDDEEPVAYRLVHVSMLQ